MEITKLYCYVDENGQDTRGRIFIVSVVVTDKNREELIHLCEQLEQVSGKQKDKWGATKHERRMRYLHHIFADDRFKKVLRYKVFLNTKDYDAATINAIVSSVRWKKPDGKFTTLVYVDGLRKTKRREYGVKLRHLGLPLHQIRGILSDESNSLIRLADAVAGFVRDALTGQSKEIKTLFEKAKQENMIIEITE